MYRTILLAYDGSLEGRLALREGARLAQVCGARVALMAIVEPSSEFFVGGVGGVNIPPDRTEEVQKILDEGAVRRMRTSVRYPGPTYRSGSKKATPL